MAIPLRLAVPLGLAIVAAAVIATTAAAPAAASGRKAAAAERARIAELPPRHQQFVEETGLLLGPEERAAFLALPEDYQRDAFIVSFWRSRDPYPDTARNELREQWQAKVEQARAAFGSLDDARARFLLLNGAPAARVEISQRDKNSGPGFRCSGIVVPTEVWSYAKENRTREEMVVIFYRPGGMLPWRRWGFDDGVEALLVQTSAMMREGSPQEGLRLIAESCGDAGEALFAAIGWIGAQPGFKYLLQMLEAESPPKRPAGEWLATFDSYSTDLEAGAVTFPAELSLAFPGRRQSRTVVQGTVRVAVADLGRSELIPLPPRSPGGSSTTSGLADSSPLWLAGAGSYHLLLTGEVLSGEELFDRFRYKFDLPQALVAGDSVPLVFERMLRPGEYRLVLKVEDLGGKRFFRVEQPLVVPAIDAAMLPPPPADALSARLFAEANALMAGGETSVRLLAPVGSDTFAGQSVLGGKVRFDALVTGDQVDSVTFALDGQPILTKTTPPWSVELDLGHLPRSQTLRATAFDAGGRALASDEIVVNASSHRFAVTITEPFPKQRFRESVRLVAKLEVPEGSQVERLEIYGDETLVATLYQPPWEQPILLPHRDGQEPGEQLTYLRAVAYLADGADTEDHVFINAPPGMEEVAVQLVELYTAVTDRNGRPAEGIDAEQLAVKEDGVPQQLVRFEQVRDLPIKVGVLLDTSASMAESLEEAQRAALAFFTDIVTPKDRAALITFNDRPRLQVKFTNELLSLGGGLAGLKAERGTSLYDSVVFSLYYFNGLEGQRALVMLSDGKDESSRLSLDDTLEFARRSGVAIYTIGLGADLEHDAKRALAKLADDTGGRSFFVDEAAQLAPVYQSIQEELRSQYLLVYQSSNAKTDKKFRRVDVKVKAPGLEAHTIRGYYP